MPALRRTRRAPRPPGSSRARWWALGALVVGAVLVVGSFDAVAAQSKDYRTSVAESYSALATQVVGTSTLTGRHLASLLDEAPVLANHTVPDTARYRIQQGLDQAVAESAQQVIQSESIVPPSPKGNVAASITAVLRTRASATSAIRSTIDGLLGMSPLPVAGGSATSAPSANSALLAVSTAAAQLQAAGNQLVEADAAYAALRIAALRATPQIRLPYSVWVAGRMAPLSPSALAASAQALATAPTLLPIHHLIISSVGLSPPAVPSGAAGAIGTSCASPTSIAPGTQATVLPPTTQLVVTATVTNCGTVTEPSVELVATLTLADGPGIAPPSLSARGGSKQVDATLPSGSSSGDQLPPFTVADGHRYVLDLTVVTHADQTDTSGTSQRFLVQISP